MGGSTSVQAHYLICTPTEASRHVSVHDVTFACGRDIAAFAAGCEGLRYIAEYPLEAGATPGCVDQATSAEYLQLPRYAESRVVNHADATEERSSWPVFRAGPGRCGVLRVDGTAVEPRARRAAVTPPSCRSVETSPASTSSAAGARSHRPDKGKHPPRTVLSRSTWSPPGRARSRTPSRSRVEHNFAAPALDTTSSHTCRTRFGLGPLRAA